MSLEAEIKEIDRLIRRLMVAAVVKAEYRKRNSLKEREAIRLWREKNREHIREYERSYGKQYRITHSEAIKARRDRYVHDSIGAQTKARWQRENREKVSAIRMSHYRRHGGYNAARRAARKADYEANKVRRLASSRTAREALSDGYVALSMRMPLESIPPPLLEAKRMHISIQRILKERS